MKISVITVVYNGERTIRDCIESVVSQTHTDIEYIVVDGASQDATMDIVRSYGNRIQKVISEPDKGIFDAMNKGIQNATGDVVALLNCDDLYADSEVLATVANAFNENPDAGCAYGDLYYVEQEDIEKVKRVWKSRVYTKGLFKTGWHPAHPTFFVKKEVYDKYGVFNLTLPVSADYEIMLRFLEKEHVCSVYIPKVMVRMRLGGNSNKSLKNILKGNKEVLQSWSLNGMRVPYWVFLFKPLSKLKQLIVTQ